MTSEFRCSAAALARGDELIGSATHVRAFLLIEHPGPWGQTALRDAAMPGNLMAGLRRRSASSGVRILLIRRHGQRGQRGVRVFAAYADPIRPWLETARLETHEEVLDLDLEALGRGESPGLEPHPDPLFCVCTHGRHDACCAERGRPVAAALSAAYPELVWEISHVGGDRFAANLLVLPDGLGYGWTDPASATRIVEEHLAGRIVGEHLRGRSGHPMPVQAAELACRRELGEWRTDALRLAGDPERTATGWRVRFAVEDVGSSQVEVARVEAGTPARLTCGARQTSVVPFFTTSPPLGAPSTTTDSFGPATKRE